MARTKKSDERKNLTLTLPDKTDEATRWVFHRLRNLANEKAWIAEQIADVTKEAKAKGVKGGAVRLAVKLGRMTPEQQKRWQEETADAAILYGYEISYTGEAPPFQAKPAQEVVNKIINLTEQRVELAQSVKDVHDAATAAKLDLASIKEFLRKSNQDHAEVCDWFDNLDATGKVLGVWDAKTWDDLRESNI